MKSVRRKRTSASASANVPGRAAKAVERAISPEMKRIDALREAFAGGAPEGVLAGIGDDAAVLAPGSEPLVWTIDAAVEGVHFRRAWLSLEDLGWRATMAAASDLAAMGARPRGLLAALVLPPDVGDAELAALAAGQRAAADALGTAVIGGNLARGGELSITTTALGAAARPIPRGGARAGDAIWIAGPVGLAAAGLALLERGVDPARITPAERAAIAAWRRPTARIDDGLRAARAATAAIDVSDGLAADVAHVARASGVAALLDEAAIAGEAALARAVGEELRAAARAIGRDPLDLALHGGEDYALVIALPPGEALAGFVRIGAFSDRAALGGSPSLVALRRSDGSLVPLAERGFDHFAKGAPRRSRNGSEPRSSGSGSAR